jgi:hypothetical protein
VLQAGDCETAAAGGKKWEAGGKGGERRGGRWRKGEAGGAGRGSSDNGFTTKDSRFRRSFVIVGAPMWSAEASLRVRAAALDCSQASALAFSTEWAMRESGEQRAANDKCSKGVRRLFVCKDEGAGVRSMYGPLMWHDAGATNTSGAGGVRVWARTGVSTLDELTPPNVVRSEGESDSPRRIARPDCLGARARGSQLRGKTQQRVARRVSLGRSLCASQLRGLARLGGRDRAFGPAPAGRREVAGGRTAAGAQPLSHISPAGFSHPPARPVLYDIANAAGDQRVPDAGGDPVSQPALSAAALDIPGPRHPHTPPRCRDGI